MQSQAPSFCNFVIEKKLEASWCQIESMYMQRGGAPTRPSNKKDTSCAHCSEVLERENETGNWN